MGKTQKKKAMKRHNPMRVPDTHLPKGLAVAATVSTKTDAILPIIQKLESVEPQDRVWACAAVSNVIQNDSSTRRLLQGKNIVGVLINRLSDPVQEVVEESSGALRNLCVDGGYDVCSEMYNKNILVPLRACISNISNALQLHLQKEGVASQEIRRMIGQFSENVLTIIWCLSEASSKALNDINNAPMIPFLMNFLSSKSELPTSTVIAAAQCLFVLSDDNDPTIETLRTNSDYISSLVRFIQTPKSTSKMGILSDSNVENNMDTDVSSSDIFNELHMYRQIYLRILACGILRNISPLPSVVTVAAEHDDNPLLAELMPVLDVSLPEIASKVTRLVIPPNSNPLIPLPNSKSDHQSDEERELQLMEQKLANVQLSLEILMGVAATLPSSVGDAYADESDDVQMEQQVPELEPLDYCDETRLLPTLFSTLTVPLLRLAQPTELSFPPIGTISLHPPTTAALSNIHVRALECLNNLFTSLALGDGEQLPSRDSSGSNTPSAVSIWAELWTILMQVGYRGELGQERRLDIWIAAIGALWGIARMCKGMLEFGSSEVQTLIEFCEKIDDDEAKVKAIGTLECLAQVPTSIETNKIIATYLMTLLQRPSKCYPGSTLQAVSAIIDIYSDENAPYDVNFRQLGWLRVLRDEQSLFKDFVRGIDARKSGGQALREHGKEICMNLQGFIQYRQALNLD